jgi:hypothetical protein
VHGLCAEVATRCSHGADERLRTAHHDVGASEVPPAEVLAETVDRQAVPLLGRQHPQVDPALGCSALEVGETRCVVP